MVTPEDLKKLGTEYFEKVLGHIPSDERQTALVYFGNTGDGVHPNYQIQTSSGTVTYLGRNHLRKGASQTADLAPKNGPTQATYNPWNLLGPYTVDAVENRLFDEVAQGPSVAEEDLFDAFSESSVLLTRGVAEMLAEQDRAPDQGTTLDALAQRIDPNADQAGLSELESTYIKFANEVAQELGLTVPGMLVLAKWEAKVGWTLKPETLKALHRTILKERNTWPDNKGAIGWDVPALTTRRNGQGGYRLRMRRLWDSRCSVTDCAVLQVLVASHATPWKDSNGQQKGCEFNGLLLIGTLDKLFDAGLIAFAENGRLLRSPTLSRKDRETLGLTGEMCLRPNPKLQGRHLPYLKAHRQQHGFC